MLAKLKSILKFDAFKPGIALFPAIDSQALADSLAIKDKAKERGESDQPEATSSTLDSVEMEIISAVEELRQAGLESYQNHLKVYKDRVSRLSQVRQEVQLIEGKAKTDFAAALNVWSNRLQNELRDVEETYRGYQDFKEKNKLTRPAKPEPNVPFFWALSVFLLLLESVANGMLFAEDNPMGLLGGVTVALLISVLNVGIAMMSGFFGRHINSIHWARKVLGAGLIIFWILAALGFNLSVGHFRDVIGQTTDIRLDGTTAISNLIANPLGITEYNSWVLVGVGLLISIVVYWKSYSFGDPYPGYLQIARQLKNARQAYANRVESSIELVLDQRDEAVTELREMQDLMTATIDDSIQALTGESTINAHLKNFLNQCDLKVNQLLAVYRDENRIYRSSPVPARFNEAYKFPQFQPEPLISIDLDEAKRDNSAIAKSISESITEIFNQCESALDKYKNLDELELSTSSMNARAAG